jgi:hypothetical protein
MKRIASLSALLLIGACGTTASVPPPDDGIARAGLGERVYVDGPRVTPLKVVEDSRCPWQYAECVAAGQMRLSIKIDLGVRSETREIIEGERVQVADGELSLVEVEPSPDEHHQNPQKPYRFGFTFAGGI